MRLCLTCADAVGVDGAGVSMLASDHFTPVAASDHLASEIEDMQSQLREGPCYDAVAAGSFVLAPDLTADDVRARWPVFSKAALQAGIKAVFGFPITFAGKPVGALDMYSRTRCSLSHGDIDDALILADLTAIAVHDLSERGSIEEVGLSSRLDEPWLHQSVVHHATGMTAVQLGVDVDEAVLRLRAYAFAASRSLTAVATDVVARRLRLDDWNADR
ncbi:MAG: hypothetical protein JWN99_298 [Ilumatobacteraceae bacterium]|nr:hypothetical protein [Ilumatobacteraceae bacterium]